MTKSSWLMNRVASRLKSVVPANDLKSLNRLSLSNERKINIRKRIRDDFFKLLLNLRKKMRNLSDGWSSIPKRTLKNVFKINFLFSTELKALEDVLLMTLSQPRCRHVSLIHLEIRRRRCLTLSVLVKCLLYLNFPEIMLMKNVSVG